MYKKPFKNIIIICILFILSINSSSAWLGIFAETGDFLNISKWNELVTNLNTKLDQTNVVGSANIDVTNSGTGVTISFTGGISSSSIPYITTTALQISNISTSTTFNFDGINFVPTTNVSIPSWPGTIDSTTINSPTNFTIDVTSAATIGTYDVVISNAGILNTLWSGNGNSLIQINPPSVWNDLRLGGDVFTDGNGAGNDIRYRAGMSLTRDSSGMFFSGSNPWSSWVKFESLSWTRGENKTIDWVFTTPTGAMMVGIGSDATNETSTAQYTQAEVQVYFNSETAMWGLYGNNGTIGSAGVQANSINISGCASQVFKGSFSNDGTVGSSTYTLYCLPSSVPGDWDDISNILGSVVMGGTLNPNETNIMPFIIPRIGGAQRFIAVKVE